MGHGDARARDVGEALAAFAAGEVSDLYEYWFDGTRGHSPRSQAALARRDRLIAEAAALHPGPTTRDTARALARDLTRYQSDAWPRERAKPSNPHRAGTQKYLYWEVLRISSRGLGVVQVIRILRRLHRPL
jgi:hypothetical protein